MSALKLYVFAFLAFTSVGVTLMIPTYLGLWMLTLSLWILLVAANVTTVIYAFINIFLAVTFDYYLRWQDSTMLFYRGGGASLEQLGLVTTIILLLFYAMDRSRISHINTHAHVPELNLRFSRLAGWVSSFALMACSFYVITSTGTILEQQFDLNEIGRYAFLEYAALLILVSLFSTERGSHARFFFIASAAAYTLVLLLASYRMASTVSGLALFLGLMSGKSIAKYKIIGFFVIGFFSMAFVGLLRGDHTNINLLAMIGYKQMGSFGYVLDNTFTGVIETSLIYTSFSQHIPFAQKVGYFFAIIAPLPSSLLPGSLDYHSAAKAYHQTRVPGGGIIAGYVLFTDYLLIVPLLWFFARSQTIKLRIRKTMRRQHNSLQHLLFAILMITIMRWSLYGVYVLFKFLGIMFVLLFLDAIYSSLTSRRSRRVTIGRI